MASNIQFFVMMIALQITFVVLLSAFSFSFAQVNCPETYGQFAGQDINETYGQDVPTNPWGITNYVTALFDQQCTGIPFVFILIVMIPLSIGLIWYVIPFGGK